MPIDMDRYRGREQSAIKHTFLTRYLQSAAFKTLRGWSTFNFVDAFAGPWRVSDSTDYSDASFDQALRTLQGVRAELEKRNVSNLKVRFCFCEKDRQAVDKLRHYAQQNEGLEIHVFPGLFEENLEGIASACEDGFTFTFIDPTGWNIDSGPILRFLRERKGEFLLNFMAEHVNRHAGYAKVEKSIGRFLADPEWEAAFSALPPNWNNEARILDLLKRRIKESGAAKFLPDFPIMKPRADRVKMRLLLGTRSPKGLEVFRETQWIVERFAIKTQYELRDSGGKQIGLFSHAEVAAMEQGAAGVGCPEYRNESEKRILALLTDRPVVRFDEIATSTMEAVPMRLTQVKDLVNELRERGVVIFELPPRKRVPQPDTQISLVNQPIP